MTACWDWPCADQGLTSYRYRGRFGWIMIGATDTAEALREAGRSTDGPILRSKLEVWTVDGYQGVDHARA